MDLEARAIDILILSNGPGELMTWVRPVVAQLYQLHPEWRISVILAPCANASGNEADLARSFVGVSRVQGAKQYQRFVLTGETGWDWHAHGAMIFLGGDQGFAAFIAWRLKYPLIVYAEWQVRYPQFTYRIGLRNDRVYPNYTRDPQKFRIIGDLNVDGLRLGASEPPVLPFETSQLIGLLPGSKGIKLTMGMPLLLRTAEILAQTYPEARFVLPVAPTIQLAKLAVYATAANPNIALLGGVSAQLETRDNQTYLVTEGGLEILIWQRAPAYDVMRLCRVCVTTVGVNTAELAALGVPMVVVIPLNKVEIMKAWDGIPGLAMQLPLVGNFIARQLNPWLIKRMGLLAWPNLLAQEMIVPELKQVLTPADIAAATEPFLTDDALWQNTHNRLIETMGQPGAVANLLVLVEEALQQKQLSVPRG